MPYFIRQNNEDLILAIQSAGVERGRNGFRKNKSMEKQPESEEFSILRIGEYPIPSIIDIVNSIRLAKGNVFAEWKQSDTAKLFEHHGYKNTEQVGGYFF